tara:strand:- start:903 stop:1259 length:357 start_codon:yes stop_codon:yes gene_type:complete
METVDQLRWKLSEEFIGFREDCPNHESSVCSTCCDLGYVPKTVLSLLDIIDNLDVSISRTQRGLRYVTICTYWGGEYYGEAESVDLALCQAVANSVFNPDNDSLEDEDADNNDEEEHD